MWTHNPYLRFGTGNEPIAWAALVFALGALALALSRPARRALARSAPTPLLATLCGAAALLSWGYVAHYLRGGPRIIDAAHYYLQARALAHGYFAFPVPEPTASFNGRFLLTNANADRLAVLFPPGYPALLALAFWAKAPLALGPLLAALLVAASYRLSRELDERRDVALTAAGLSVLSAALRYHTADTMSHGLAALLVAATAIGLLRGSRGALAGAGLAAGWLFATRPVTGLVVLACALGYVLCGARRREAPWLILGLAPGLAFLIWEQGVVSGHWLGSSQLAYYSRADGPPGCFRYGFGAGIGCLFEHGDYVRARLPHGYGLWQASATTLRRLLVHSIDVANAAPLALGVPLGAWFARGERRYLVVSLLVVGIVLAYAPFYFEASYPGAGARLFCDALPLEHVLVARALATLRITRFAWPAALLGFALHASSQHAALRDREGGRPMFEPARLSDRGITRGLVFVNTDHGFALGHEPGRLSAAEGLIVARERSDALDVLLWERLGRPVSYRYVYDPSTSSQGVTIQPWSPKNGAASTPTLRVEAESLWPPVRVEGGWVHPDFSAEPCASRGRGLRVRSANEVTEIVLPLTNSQPDSFSLGSVGIPPTIEVLGLDAQSRASWIRLDWKADAPGCWHSIPRRLVSVRGARTLTIRSSPGLIDYIEWDPALTEKGVDN
jgi:hypothetical protein